ncbi:MAG: sulfite exporter TauE/SafE family protein [Verrucomicrobia bacterium]|nr:sulfite exporter TauE/SafE family protein [Verrucomicrobiota bacterium]
MPSLSLTAWLIALAAALCTGFAKSGFGPFGILSVLFMAEVLPPLESTGVVLPLLLFADLLAVLSFHSHASWKALRALLPTTLMGIITGWLLMPLIPAEFFGHALGWITLALIGVILLQRARPETLHAITRHPLLGLFCGWAAGVTTMVANMAGPITAFYFLSQRFAKMTMVGTGAWFYLSVNTAKLPFSWQLGLLNSKSLILDLLLFPGVFLGFLIGRTLLPKVSQNLFEWILILMALGAAIRMIAKT